MTRLPSREWTFIREYNRFCADDHEVKTHRILGKLPNVINYLGEMEAKAATPNNYFQYFPPTVFMEHARGGDLRQLTEYVRARGLRIPADFMFHVLESVLTAIIDMQDKTESMHSDLHPGNVTFLPDPQHPGCFPDVKLIDLEGVKHISKRSTENNSIAYFAWQLSMCRGAFPGAFQDVLGLGGWFFKNYHEAQWVADNTPPCLRIGNVRQSEGLLVQSRSYAGTKQLTPWLSEYFDHIVIANSP